MRKCTTLLLASLVASCDHNPAEEERRERESILTRLESLERHVERHDDDINKVANELRRGTTTDKPTAAAARPTDTRDRCPNPLEHGRWGTDRWNDEWHIDEPPTGLPSFKIYYGLWREADCLPETSPCRGLPEPDKLESGSLATCGYPSTSSWAKVLRSALDAFVAVPRTYDDTEQQRIQTSVAYGILQTVDGGLGEYSGDTHHDFRSRVLPFVLRSRRLTGIAYDWAMPHLRGAWQELPPDAQRIYLGILEHGQRYLSTFSMKREQAYLAQLQRGVCDPPEWLRDNDSDGVDDDGDGQIDEDAGRWDPKRDCERQFVARGPDGEQNPYRKLEAFVFRRVQQGVAVADMKLWLDRVIGELRPLTPSATAAR